MKKRKKTRKLPDASIGEEIQALFAQQEMFEYHGLIDEQEIMTAKSQYLELLVHIERSVFSEKEREEIEKRAAGTWEKIERIDRMLSRERERIAELRARLESVRDAYQARSKAKRSKRKQVRMKHE